MCLKSCIQNFFFSSHLFQMNGNHIVYTLEQPTNPITWSNRASASNAGILLNNIPILIFTYLITKLRLRYPPPPWLLLQYQAIFDDSMRKVKLPNNFPLMCSSKACKLNWPWPASEDHKSRTLSWAEKLISN